MASSALPGGAGVGDGASCALVGVLGQIRISIPLHGLVVQLAEVKNFKRVTHCSCFIQHPGIVSKPCKHLLSGRGVNALESSG